MNPIKKIFELLEYDFSDAGKFAKLGPLFDATKTFFFLPSPRTRLGPFIRDHLDLKRYMSVVLLSLMPVLFFGMYNTGYQSGLARGES
ncbi:MAG TPA: NADH:ubiquinone reductase (Na(+)-transporting) subunit B, partial [Desulfotignum sp.]|nr:NADH:ubiquinone reductase (Na(+)-transporting) subunit B [Desulfotignum sp.]